MQRPTGAHTAARAATDPSRAASNLDDDFARLAQAGLCCKRCDPGAGGTANLAGALRHHPRNDSRELWISQLGWRAVDLDLGRFRTWDVDTAALRTGADDAGDLQVAVAASVCAAGAAS